MAEKPAPPSKAAPDPKPTNDATTKDDKPKSTKTRAPRQDYGFKPGAVINLAEDFDVKKYRGKRGEYAAVLASHDGKTVEAFMERCPQADPPRGWLRFFVQSGACALSGGKDPEPKQKPEKEGEGDAKAA